MKLRFSSFGLGFWLLMWSLGALASPDNWLQLGEFGWANSNQTWLNTTLSAGFGLNQKLHYGLMWSNGTRYGQSSLEARSSLTYAPTRQERGFLVLGGGYGAWVPHLQVRLGWDQALGQGSLHLLMGFSEYAQTRLEEWGVGQSWYWGNWRAYVQGAALRQEGGAGAFWLWGAQGGLVRYFGGNSLSLLGGEGVSATGSMRQPLAQSWNVALVWRERLSRHWEVFPVLRVQHLAKQPLFWGAGLALRYQF